MRASNYTTVLSLALAFLLLATSLAQDTTAAPQDTTTAALLDTTQSPASQDSTTQAPQDGSAEGTPKPKGLVIVTTALLTGNNQGQQGQGWQGQGWQGQGSNQGSGQSSSSSSSSSSSGQWNQGSQSSGSQNSQGSQSSSSQGSQSSSSQGSSSQGSSSQGYQSSQSSQDRGDGVLSSNPDIPFPPPNCRNRAQSLQYTNGYQAAWRVILRAWDQSEGCNKFDSFQSMIKSATPNGGSCYARGYTQAIDDAVATTSRTCKSDCADIGDITGSSGASIFCGVTAPEFRSFGASKCTRIGIQTCQTAFRSTVQSKCPEQLDTFQYQSEIRKVCSPSGLGQ